MSLHRGSTSETAHHHEFFRPTSALWWLYLSACLACSSATVIHFGATIAQVKYSLLTLLPFYLASGLFFFWIVLLCDPYRARRPWVMFAAFVGGAGITLYPAMKGNNLYPAFLLHIMSEEKALAWMPAIAGPTTEEWTKMACTLVIMLIAKSTLTRPIHGLLIGACVGLGFQILENIVYGIEGSIGHLQGDLTQSTSIGISRFATGFASHNLFTAISGVGVAVLLGRTVGERWSRSRRIATFLGLYLLSWFLHFFGNSIGAFTPPLVLVVLGASTITAFMAFALVLRWVWHQERRYLAEAATAVSGTEPGDTSRLTELQSAAIGTHKTRNAFLRKIKKTRGRAEAKAARTDMRSYLEHLQAWGRRGTGIDEAHSSAPDAVASTTVPHPLDDDTLYLEPVGIRR
ncbi:PrsW family intramembrane metalloprotease [Austwickia chelonae]|uniref:PrsW family intramembrane metalloprotease n=1 Tax=Austwickia chelonae TaxID=100225 RepID=UPI001F078CBC|nr:PrsW family intramembrane metalloprotease [Austwickia chelonae]